MLKITKGLKPFVDDEGISIYTSKYSSYRYVRVKMDGEDFCIEPYDYNDGNGNTCVFMWDDAMKALEDDGMTTFTKEQVHLCAEYRIEIADKLKEIGKDFKKEWYWTVDEYDVNCAWCFDFKYCNITNFNRENHFVIRPVLNL